MSDITISYKGTDIATMDASGTKTLQTSGKYCEDDITLQYVKPSGGTEAPWNDVCFWDYDGKCLYSYSAAEFAQLSALPANPSHAGLTAQGWNWSLSDAKDYVSANGFLDIGQLYVTSDDKTHVHVVFTQASSLYVTIRLTGSVAGNITINWGDGSAEESTTGTTATTFTHTYATVGTYDITISRSSGTVTFGDKFTSRDRSAIKEINLGSNVVLGENCFQTNMGLTKISMPSDCNVSNFGGGFGIRCLILPSAILTGNKIFSYSPVETICFAKQGALNNYSSKFENDQTLRRISAPVGVSGGGLGNKYFMRCSSLQRFILGETTGLASTNATDNLWSLKKLIVPATVTGINCFSNVYSLTEVHMKATTPPTLSNTSVFSNRSSDFKIYVPYSEDHSVLQTYQGASIWSSYSSYIVEESA